jgi:protein-S-isoprenylcysteine O-methyltransferase Ste14
MRLLGIIAGVLGFTVGYSYLYVSHPYIAGGVAFLVLGFVGWGAWWTIREMGRDNSAHTSASSKPYALNATKRQRP